MKVKVLLALFVFFAVVVVQVQAAEKDSFWNNLQQKVQKLKPSQKPEVTTVVGGVRGAKSETSSDVYWKGKEKPDSITEEELKKFNQALDTKMKGNNEQALKLFEEFLNAYPQSSLRVEALQAVDKIKAEMAPAKTTKKAVKKSPPKNTQENK